MVETYLKDELTKEEVSELLFNCLDTLHNENDEDGVTFCALF